MNPRVGQTLLSTVDKTTVVVVRWQGEEREITCGGAPMTADRDSAHADAVVEPDQADGTQLGKRYVDENGGVELLCTKPGQGTLAVGGVPLQLKEAKPLPASD